VCRFRTHVILRRHQVAISLRPFESGLCAFTALEMQNRRRIQEFCEVEQAPCRVPPLWSLRRSK
jgi:hypothetical protein